MANYAIFLLLASSLAFYANASPDTDLLAALEVGGQQQDLVVDATAGAQLANGKKRGLGQYKPMTCTVKRYDDVQYFGTLTKFFLKVDNVDLCVSACWQYNQANGGNACRSVNYLGTLHKCELMSDVLDVNNKAMFKYYARANGDSVYAIPEQCVEAGKPVEPQPAAPTSVSGRAARAGGCGQTYVSPRATFQRIVGGYEARPNSLPWQVSLRSGDWHFCGGSLIRTGASDQSDIVVTAAHCLYRGANDLRVAVGAHWKSRQQPGEQRISAATYVLHPQYNPNNFDNDLAIVKLSQPVRFSNTIQPVCLPQRSEQVADNSVGIVSGWGDLREGTANYPDALNQVSVPTIGTSACQSNYNGVYSINGRAMLCAGYPYAGKDSCQGDSGGPFVFQGRDGYVLQGVVSFGEGCARANKPGVYSRVSSYIDWIEQQVRSLSSGGSGGTGGVSNNCKDTITYCNQYANECNSASWMKDHCQKTCGFCR